MDLEAGTSSPQMHLVSPETFLKQGQNVSVKKSYLHGAQRRNMSNKTITLSVAANLVKMSRRLSVEQ